MSVIRKLAFFTFFPVLIFSVWGCSTEGKPGTLTEAEKSVQSTPESSGSSLSQPDPAPANTLVNKTPQELNTSIVTQANAQTNTQTKAQANTQTNDTPGQTEPPPKKDKEQLGSGFKAARVTSALDALIDELSHRGVQEIVYIEDILPIDVCPVHGHLLLRVPLEH